MPFNLGPKVPGQIDPEDKRQQVPPTDFPEFLFQVPTTAPAEGSGLTSNVQEHSSSLTRALLGEERYGRLMGGQAKPQFEVTGVDEAPTDEHRALSHWQNMKLAMSEGVHLMLAGAGSYLENHGAASPEQQEAQMMGMATEKLPETLKKYGEEMRRSNAGALAQMAQEKPQGFVDWAVRETGRMLPIVGIAIAGGAAGGVGAAFATAFGPSYLTNKALLQTDLENQGVSKTAADTWSTAAAVPMALADAAYPTIQTRKLAQAFGEEVIGAGVRKTTVQLIAAVAKHAGEGAVVNAITQAAKEGVSLTAQAQATGRTPSVDEVIKTIGQSALGAAGAGALFGGTFGFYREAVEAHRVRINEAIQAKAEAALTQFDPSTAPEGTEIMGKKLRVLANGRRQWVSAEDGHTFVKAPKPGDYEAHLEKQIIDTQAAAKSGMATSKAQPVDVPIDKVSEGVSASTGGRLDPKTTQLNIRALAVDQLPSTRRQLKAMTSDEQAAFAADLEALSLDETAEMPVRLTAAAKKRAIDYIQREKTAAETGIENLEITIGAKALAQRDGPLFEKLAVGIRAGDNQIDKRILQEAELLRANSLVPSAAKEVTERIRSGRTVRQRGLGVGSRVASVDGAVGKVVALRKTGGVDVVFDGSQAPTTIDPGTVTLIPEPGQKVTLQGGQVADVLEVGDRITRVRLPDGSETTVEPKEIEAVAAAKPERARASKKQAAQAAERKVEVHQALPLPLEAVDTRSGQRVEVRGLGQTTAKLADGSVIDMANLNFGAEPVKVMEPATQPAEGRHINFLMLPEGPVSEAFEQKLSAGESIHDYLAAAAVEGDAKNGLYLLPQPHKKGTKLYAVEMPADARILGGDAKRLLGVLSGKSDALSKSMTKARVALGRELQPNELKVSVVPDALRAAAADLHKVAGKSIADQREYLKRLADLNFKMDPEVSAALVDAGDKAQAAADARIEGNVGKAEVAEIEAQTARVNALQVAIEKDIAERTAIWDRIQSELRKSMSPSQNDLIDQLNATDLDDLAELPGIGQALAKKIMDAKAQAGGKLAKVEDLFKVKGMGPGRLAQLQKALSEGAMEPGDRIGAKHEAAIKALLAELPPRTGNTELGGWKPIFEHPDIPGMRIMIDKERVPTAMPDLTDPLKPKVVEGERDVFHIRYLTPEGDEVHARTVGMGENVIRVPQHLATARGGRGTPEAIERINNGRRTGRSISDVIDEMMDERHDVQKVTLKGSERVLLEHPETGEMVPIQGLSPDEISRAGAQVVQDPEFLMLGQGEEEEGGRTSVILQDEKGEKVQVPAERVKSELGRVQEPLAELTLPFRLDDQEVLGEVMREIRGFDKKAYFLSPGEWRSQIPGVYADIRKGSGGYQAAIFREPQSRVRERVPVSSMSHMKTFATEEAAQKWLVDRGFAKSPSDAASRDVFKSLPPLNELSPENLERVHKALTAVLQDFKLEGHIPQPVRDYAVGFAEAWNKAGFSAAREGGLFSDRGIRRTLGIYEIKDAYRAALKEDPEAQVHTGASPDITFENGRIVVERPTVEDEVNDTRVLGGILLNPKVSATDPARLEQARALYEQTEHRERFLDLVAGQHGRPFAEIAQRLVKIGPEGRLGVIIESNPGADHLTVQVSNEGLPLITKVLKKDVTRVRSPEKALDYYRAYKDGLGELTNLPRTPDMGLSPLDRRLGLDDITSPRIYADGLRRRVAQVLRRVIIHPDGSLGGDPTQIRNLRDAYIRMKELGMENTALPTNQPEESNKSFTERHGEVVAKANGVEKLDAKTPLIPRLLERTLQDEAHRELANQYSTASPYGDLIARAKVGKLGGNTVRQIDEIAKANGIDPKLPTYRKAEELVSHVFDPATAHRLYQMRRDLGMLAVAEDIELPDHGFELRAPAMGTSVHTNAFVSKFTFPREIANRHPTPRMIFQTWERARSIYGDMVKSGADVIAGLTGWRTNMSLDRKQAVWDLLTSDKLAKVQRTPSEILTRDQIIGALGGDPHPGWDWYHQYNELRNLLTHNLEQTIRNEIRRGFKPEEISYKQGMTPDEHMKFLEKTKIDRGLTAPEMESIRERTLAGEKVYELNRNSNALHAQPESQVNKFLDLRRTYKSLSDIPADVRSTMEPWMISDFDFWANYGIKNYAPVVLQGDIKILMKGPDGKDQLKAFAPDGLSALKFMHDVRRGKYEDIPVNAELSVKYGKARPDYDIDINYLGGKNYSRLYARMAKLVEDNNLMPKIADMMSQELKIAGEPAMPMDPHTQARLAEMEQLIEDPYKRILLYHGRTARSNYLLDIQDAYFAGREMDSALSVAHGIDPVFPNKDMGITGTPAVHQYIEDLRSSFMGEPTKFEKTLNSMVAVGTTLAAKPTLLPEFIKRTRDPNYVVFEDPLFVSAIHNADFTSRRWAQTLIQVQSTWRLGWNLGSAAVNATQHMMYTPAELVTRGIDPVKAEAYALAGYKDAINYLRGRHGNEKYEDLLKFAEATGVGHASARGTQGPGLGLPGGRPIFFSDDNFIHKTGRLYEWLAMTPFTTAERSVRLAAAFSAKRAAEAKGLTGDEAVQFARSVIDNTQFQYHDQALPPVMRGPLARVWLQFSQYAANAMKYEKDLFRAMMPERSGFARTGTIRGVNEIQTPGGGTTSARAAAAKAWLVYNATGLALGGAAWETARPLWALPSWVFSKFSGQTPTQFLMNHYGHAEERAKASYGTQVGDPELMEARNAVLYGVPGLLGWYTSARLGVSGLDLDPTRMSDLLAGPTGTTAADAVKALSAYSRTNGKQAMAGFAAGELSQLLGARFPMGSVFAPVLATGLVSQVSGQKFQDFLRENPEGRTYINSLLPTYMRGIQHTVDVFGFGWDETPGVTHDPNYQRHEYVGGLNRTFEAVSAIVGLQPIRVAEERALLNYRFALQDERLKKRADYINQAASVAMTGAGLNDPKVHEIIVRSIEDGAGIDLPSVQDEVDSRRKGPIEKSDAKDTFLRGGGRLNPSGDL